MSTNTEILICETGNHEWTRQRTKGRKPRYCPEHAPVVETKTAMVELTCKAGHTWERPRTKGKQPIWCPEHKPQAQADGPKTEELTCAHDGHTWTRVKRGRAPQYCPEHKPEKVTAHSKVGSKSVPKIDLDNELVIKILDGPESELRRKLSYVVSEFRNPRPNRESGDWKLLQYTFNRLLEEAARALRQSVTIDHILLED